MQFHPIPYLYPANQNAMLKVYHASAGTGKTFTLVLNYLTLLLRDPDKYRHILSVTFTNKATAEMKERIIRVLYGLSHLGTDRPENRKETAEAWLYLLNMPEELKNEDREVIRKKASRALRWILYDYSYFSVQTIDSFFQRVLRGFARELNLRFGYNIELDTRTTLERVVDLLLKDVGDNPVLLDWLVRFMDDVSEETGKWDVRKLILEQGHQIFSESFKMIPPVVLQHITGKEDDYLKKYLDRLYTLIRSFEGKMKDYGERGLEIIYGNHFSLDEFTSGNRGPAGIFQKMTERNYVFGIRFLTALDDPAKWLTKVRQQDPELMRLVREHLHPLAREMYAFFKAHYEDYYTARAIRSQIYILGILADLKNGLLQWMNKENRFLITEVGPLIRQIIGDNETPFIYEKIGQFYEHYMIDEFQDTSRIQYENLKPLVMNSLSAGYFSLIVGDIKQSIYRWRNGDWKIMGKQLYGDFQREQLGKKVLRENNRSHASIVRFNNVFFRTAPDHLWDLYVDSFGDFLKKNRYLDWPDHTFLEEAGLQDQKENLLGIYNEEEVVQKVRTDMPYGYVYVSFPEKVRKEEWMERVMAQVADRIGNLLTEEGYRPEQIVLLVRTNAEGRDMIRYLLTRQQEGSTVSYPLVSEDSLFLNSSETVRFIVAFLRYLSDPEDDLNFAVLWHLHDRLTGYTGNQERLPEFHLKQIAGIKGEDRILLISGVTHEWLIHLNTLPLTEVVQEIIRFFALEKKKEEVPFIYTFQNHFLDFVNSRSAALADFLTWWDEQGCTQSVQMPEEVDAVRVMSIHKAKGLGAEVVIMPFADWNFEQVNTRTVVWCRPRKDTFAALPVVPLVYSPVLMKSVFRDDYLEEHFANYLDNLNLLYVAFTRAKERLYIWSAGGRSGDTGRLLNQTVKSILEKKENGGLPELPVRWDNQEKVFEAGAPRKNREEKAPAGVRVDSYPVYTAFDRLRIARKGQRFFILQAAGAQEKIDRGTLYHTILSGIKTKADVEPVLLRNVAEGLIQKTDMAAMLKEIASFLEQPGVAGWFSGDWDVRNEATIIHPGGRMLRPDRVMIRQEELVVVDYKFGETEEPAYIRQVRQYMESLRAMGYASVTGWIWYVTLNKRVKVDG